MPILRVMLAPGRVLCAIDAQGMPLSRLVGFYDGGRTPMPEGEPVEAVESADGSLVPRQALYAGAWASGSLVLHAPQPAPADPSSAPAEAPVQEP